MSGGPILDTYGRVLGVITRGFGKDLDSGMYTEYRILAGILLTIEGEYSHFGEKRCGFLADLQSAVMVEFDETLTGIKITRESERTSFDYGSGRVLTVRGSWNV